MGEPGGGTSSARTSSAWERVGLAVAAVVVLAHLLGELWKGLFTVWSGSRLAFSAALVRGIDIYPTADAGVVTGDMYGPFMAIYYLPALLAPSITSKLLVAEALAVLAMLVPAAMLVARELRRHGASRFAVMASAVILLGVFMALSSTRYQLASIHADAPCLGLGMLSFVLLTHRDTPRLGVLLGAAFLVALATLTKPLGAFVAAGEALLLWRVVGLRAAVVFSAAYAALLPALAFALPPLMGSTFDGMWFNAVTLPSKQELELDLSGVMYSAVTLVRPLLGLAAVSVLARWVLRSGSEAGTSEQSTRRCVGGLWTLAVVLLPISYVATRKVGGDVNSMHAHYYAITAAVLALSQALVSRVSSKLPFVAVACVVASLGSIDSLRGLYTLGPIDENPHERVAAYLRKHDDTYFPWHSLSMLEARGTMFHHSDGLHSRALSRLPVTRQHFFAHAPAAPSYVALPKSAEMLPARFVFAPLVAMYYPGYQVALAGRTDLRTLGLTVYKRP